MNAAVRPALRRHCERSDERSEATSAPALAPRASAGFESVEALNGVRL